MKAVIISTTGTGQPYFNIPQKQINREDYERDLKERQKKHLANIGKNTEWQPCLHDGCASCHGTGRKSDGSMCIHGIACPCPRCSPR